MLELDRGVAESIGLNDIGEDPLRIKLGIDPTTPNLHLGFVCALRKMRQLQELGHTGILLFGDFTACIGDPTGRSEARKQLTRKEVRANGERLKEQAMTFLLADKTEVRWNSEWLDEMGFADVIGLSSRYTVARLLERDDFSKRFNNQQPIGVHELLYPLIQGYDSVVLEADVEMGGLDQKFNMMVGRALQKDFGQDPQAIVMLELLLGIDGVKKMSKTFDNTINVNDEPKKMYGKLMSIPDNLVKHYAHLCTNLKLEAVAEALEISPSITKKVMARDILNQVYGIGFGAEIQINFTNFVTNVNKPVV